MPPSAFEPAPEVDFGGPPVGETRPRRLDPADEEDLWRLVQAGFRERRKMLHNVLPRQLPAVERATLVAALDAGGHRARATAADALGRGLAGPRGRPGAAAVTVRRAAAPAKVNLTLAVSERRPDGYHDLSTILVRIGLADRLTARPTGAAPTLAR